jgi:hypothetical protein
MAQSMTQWAPSQQQQQQQQIFLVSIASKSE